MSLAWTAQAACRGQPNTLFFPDREPTEHSKDQRPYRRGLAVCATCPVIAECAEYGAGQKFGIWGGTTPAMREAERRRRSKMRKAIPPCAICGSPTANAGARVCPERECQLEYGRRRQAKYRAGLAG